MLVAADLIFGDDVQVGGAAGEEVILDGQDASPARDDGAVLRAGRKRDGDS